VVFASFKGQRVRFARGSASWGHHVRQADRDFSRERDEGGTELRTFPSRTHWIIAQDGWEEVAQACIDWIGSLRAVPERTTVRRVIDVQIA
jgi:hypothetical protein